MHGKNERPSRILTNAIQDCFENSLLIACLNTNQSSENESLCTLKFVHEFYTFEKRKLFTEESSKQLKMETYNYLKSEVRMAFYIIRAAHIIHQTNLSLNRVEKFVVMIIQLLNFFQLNYQISNAK